MYPARLLLCAPDSWVSVERWEEVFPIYREQYGQFIDACIASRAAEESEAVNICTSLYGLLNVLPELWVTRSIE